MAARITAPFASSQEGSFRRVRRRLDPVTAPRDELAAASMEAGAEVRRLVEDLTSLVDAGLIEPVYCGGELRFELVESENPVENSVA